MAFPSDAKRAKERREEERMRAREEQKRQAELERREEEQRERDREEERRQDALRQAQEFEAADEAERQRREAFRSRVRQQLRIERRSAVREQVRRDARLEALRAANRQERQDEHEEAARDAERREELQRQTAIDRRENEQREQRQSEQRRREQNAQQERRREEQQAEDDAAARSEESREARRREQAVDARDRARAEEQRDAQRETAREARNDEQQDSRRAEKENADRRAAAARARQEERHEAERAAERDAQRAEVRQAAAQQLRRGEQQQAQASEARRQSVRDGRLAERRDAEQVSERAAERARGRAAAREEPKPKAKPASPGRDALQARIPSGVLSGALPWLVVDKNRVANLDGQPVLLRGISMLGMDSAPPDAERGFAAGAGINASTIDAILEWGANVIRVSINRQRVLNGSGTWSAAQYLQDLDWIVRRAAEGGAYTILSLRRLDESTVFGTFSAAADGPTLNVIAPQPDYDTVGMWQLLGARYSDEPAVLFDLYTSPHTALADDLTGFDTDWDLWALWVRLIVAELRRLHPRALCFVSGLNWATDLSGFPIIGTESEPVPNLVYAAHLSPRLESPLIAMRALGRSHPLFVTEWGAPTEISWCERMALVLRDAGVGWTAAHWNGEPFLARATGRQTSATQFGLVVRRALALPVDRIGRIA